MLCIRPFKHASGAQFGCGQCLSCRINKRRLWTARMVLEAGQHYQSVFATLTYSSPGPWSVSPRHMQLFMKRLRRAYPAPLRFFGVGEYGEKNWRPHYHLAIFGMSMIEHSWDKDGVVCGGPVYDAWWPWGNVHVGELSRDSAQYIAGYTTKKMTREGDDRLAGRHPEFARMSNRPGIGAGFARGAAAALLQPGGSNALALTGDVPFEARIDGHRFPLGRYLRGKLREEVGWDSKTPQASLDQIKAREAALTPLEIETREANRQTSYGKAQLKVKIQRSKGTI